jgi:hypothetical protein
LPLFVSTTTGNVESVSKRVVAVVVSAMIVVGGNGCCGGASLGMGVNVNDISENHHHI